jgi:hypothetical protein
MSRSSIPFDSLMNRFREFAALAPVIIQTMLCKIGGEAPPPEEAQAWEKLVTELARTGTGIAGIRGVQIYGKARPAPDDPLAESLPESFLEDRAQSLLKALASARTDNPGASGKIPPPIPVEVFP